MGVLAVESADQQTSNNSRVRFHAPSRVASVSVLLNGTVRSRLLTGYLILIVLLAGSWVVAAVSASRVRENYQHAFRVDSALIDNVNLRVKLLDDQETSVRGYLLTNRNRYLQPYHAALRQLPSVRAESARLAMQATARVRVLDRRLTRAGTAWQEWAKEMLARADAAASPYFLTVMDQGKLLFDRYRTAAAAFQGVLSLDRGNDLRASDHTIDAMNLILASVFGGAIILLVVIGYFTVRSVTKPLGELGRAAEQIGQGNFNRPVQAIGAREFSVLASTMESMRIARKNAEEALATSEARQRSVLETASDAIVTMSADGRILSFNRSAEHIFGYTAAELIGKPVTVLMPERFREQHVAGLRQYLTTGEARVIGRTVELAGLRRDGDEFSLELSLAVVRQGSTTFFTSILRDVTERKRAKDALERLVRELEVKTREREGFIYTVSHDLRAPLVSVQGLVSILVEDYGSGLDDGARHYLDRIDANASKMQRLLSDLLDLERIGLVETETTPLDLGAVVSGVVEQLESTLVARGAEVRIDDPLPIIPGNETRFVQLFTNLIDNAIHYTPPERRPLVRIGAREREGAWEIIVTDNGVGIPAASSGKVFGLFQRLPSGKALNPGGTGAGLAIVARVFENQGGELWLESIEGAGSAFHFTVQKGKTAIHAAQVMDDRVLREAV